MSCPIPELEDHIEDPLEHYDSLKILLRRPQYPFAAETTSCFSLTGMDQSQVNYWLPRIKRAAEINPGAFVFGAERFPRWKADAEEFWTLAGMNQITMLMLVEGMVEREE